MVMLAGIHRQNQFWYMKIFLKMCLSYLYAGIKRQNNLHVINLIKAFVNFCLQAFADKTIDIIPISKAACHCPSHENFRCLPFYRLASQGSRMVAMLSDDEKSFPLTFYFSDIWVPRSIFTLWQGWRWDYYDKGD